MQRISYVNGRYVPHREASVHIEDRGYQFSDGIYEVIAVEQGILIDELPHLQRLERSLRELSIAAPMSLASLALILKEIIRRNRYVQGALYIQITRGVAKRSHEFPKEALPALVVTISPPRIPSLKMYEQGVSVISHPDIRWGRRDIKTISLLPNILAKQAAFEAKVREAWLVTGNGTVTEGSSSNSFIVTSKNVILTHPSTQDILHGITRAVVLKLAGQLGISFEEKAFTLEEAKAAKEAFLTSTTSSVLPIIKIDHTTIGTGQPGEITRKLYQAYKEHMSQQVLAGINHAA